MSHTPPDPKQPRRTPDSSPATDRLTEEKLQWFAERIQWQTDLLGTIRGSLYWVNIWLPAIAGISLLAAMGAFVR